MSCCEYCSASYDFNENEVTSKLTGAVKMEKTLELMTVVVQAAVDSVCRRGNTSVLLVM